MELKKKDKNKVEIIQHKEDKPNTKRVPYICSIISVKSVHTWTRLNPYRSHTSTEVWDQMWSAPSIDFDRVHTTKWICSYKTKYPLDKSHPFNTNTAGHVGCCYSCVCSQETVRIIKQRKDWWGKRRKGVKETRKLWWYGLYRVRIQLTRLGFASSYAIRLVYS